MEDLFEMDIKNYNPDAKVSKRTSVRGIIEKNGRFLLVYSAKYRYFMFPGGGIHEGETLREALIREISEETGRSVIPESVEEYGRVVRKAASKEFEDTVFEHENLYYTCRITDDISEVKLEDYEKEENYTAVWMNLLEAAAVNYSLKKSEEIYALVAMQEAKMFLKTDLYYRRINRQKNEEEMLLSLGDRDYKEMINFVKDTLGEDSVENFATKASIGYSRFEHIKRVLNWTLRLYNASENKDELRYEDLIISAIFHDVGRKVEDTEHIPHAKAGVPITRKFLSEHGFDEERTEYICNLVGSHSDKFRMGDPNIDKNLLLLMEADMLDDTGALSIMMDCMVSQASKDETGYLGCLDHIAQYTLRQSKDNPMVSEEAREIWDKKAKLVEDFYASLEEDLMY